uniref:Uncharacterized protein n=1 Tax=Avena sativa TaxID=4498 RepID=A0ACD5UIB5_AVESA
MGCSVQDRQKRNRGKERHGKNIDEKGAKVSCNYCGKVVQGYNRLEHHLAGIRGNVSPCDLVPESVRESLKISLEDRKKDSMLRKIDRLKHDEVPPTRSSAIPFTQVQQPHLQPNMSSNHCFLQHTPDLMDPVKMKTLQSSYESKPLVKTEDHLDSLVAKSIGRFIFEAGLERGVLHSSSLKEMIGVFLQVSGFAMPTYESILQEQLRETENRENELRQEWQRSGCSVILHSWKGLCGKSFVSVLVYCSKGMIFRRSMDVSAIIEDVDMLTAMLFRVVDDVGAHNIVQIVTNDVSPYMQTAWHYVLKYYDHSFFFALCADHCINLLLEKIAASKNVSEVLMKAKEITRFIYSPALPVELKGRYVQQEILSSSCLKFVAVFITLERLVSARVNLVNMFNSPAWDSSVWAASSDMFRHISGIVKTDDAFWSAAADVVKVTNPLVSVLYKLESEICPMGILYDAMDGAKEDIKRNLGDRHDEYWALVDRIWDGYLHSPLHAAGHMLNPRIFYSDRFHHDTEISSGITTCIIQLSQVRYNPRKAAAQLEAYQQKLGSFDSDPANQQIMGIPQVQWWLAHGARTPDLQAMAKRILSQTCFGATRYNIDWSLSEKLHAGRWKRTLLEHQGFCQMEYVHYNLVLARATPRIHGFSVGQHGRVTMVLDDWIAAPKQAAGRH